MKLEIGQSAPEFEALNQKGESVKLKDLKGQKIVLYFYPKDNTATCNIEACNIRDNYHRFISAGYKVLGVSIDPAKSHQKFIDKFELPFDLLVDDKHDLVNKYGVWVEKSLYGRKYMGTARTTFVLDENGIITDIIEKVNSKDHANQILK